MFNNLFNRKDKVAKTNTCPPCSVTDLVVASALRLTKDIEDSAKELRMELNKLEELRIGHQ